MVLWLTKTCVTTKHLHGTPSILSRMFRPIIFQSRSPIRDIPSSTTTSIARLLLRVTITKLVRLNWSLRLVRSLQIMTWPSNIDLRNTLPIACPSMECGGRLHARCTFDIQHLIVFPKLGALALDTNIKRECADGRCGSRDGEGCEGFVETAYHYAGLVVPARDYAFVAEGPGEVPG